MAARRLAEDKDAGCRAGLFVHARVAESEVKYPSLIYVDVYPTLIYVDVKYPTLIYVDVKYPTLIYVDVSFKALRNDGLGRGQRRRVPRRTFALIYCPRQGCGVGGKISDPNYDLSKIPDCDSLNMQGMKFGCC